MTADPQLRDWLTEHPPPTPRDTASNPLFNGTLVFTEFSFQEPGEPASGVSLADTQTALEYASIAIRTIERYTSRYGSSSVAVSPDIIPFTATLTGNTFTQAEFEGWADQIAQTARNNGVNNPCVIIFHNRELPASPVFIDNRNSFHSMTGQGTPYCYCLVFGQGLTIADNNHDLDSTPRSKVYAHILSHEITEMVVDPKGDSSNPEVCDSCAGNCNNIWFDLFDQNGTYLGGTADTSTATGFAFFINSIVSPNAALNSNGCLSVSSQMQTACVYPPPFVRGELLSYADAGTPGNVSAPALVGFSDWHLFKFLFAGQDATGASRIYAVDTSGQLLSYGDSGSYGNVSDPVTVGLGGWLDFKFLFAGQDATGASRIYAVTTTGQLLSYGDSGTPGNVSAPVTVGFGGWADFSCLFAGRNAAGASRIYAVTTTGELLSYGDSGTPGNVSAPVTVGFGGWQAFRFLFAGQDATGADRIYAVNTTSSGQLLSYGDSGTAGNVSAPVTVGFDDWLDFKFLFAGRNTPGQNRIYAVPA